MLDFAPRLGNRVSRGSPMRHLFFFALAIAASCGVRAIGIDEYARPTIAVPGAKLSAAAGPARPVAVTAAEPVDGPIVHRFEYDEVGNRIRHIDAEGRATRWEHDRAGRVTARILPGGQRETSEYDLGGRLVAKTDFLGRTTRYAYD